MKDQVEYKIVKNFENYRVGSDGTIWSRHGMCDWKKLKGGVDKDGYRKIILCKKGKRKYMRFATVVLTEFIGEKPAGMECCHKDGDRTNNNLWNLRWGTHKENCADKKSHGTHQYGEKHPTSKLKELEVIEIRSRYENGEHTESITKDYNVTHSCVYAVCSRKNWDHI